MITNSVLHYTILKHIIDHGYAPDITKLSDVLNSDAESVEKALYLLQEYHGVVLHPHAPLIWVIHPFSLAPTNFIIRSAKGEWWGNCAWCSLGVAALLKEDVTIITSFGAHGQQVDMHIVNGEIQEKNLFVHFPVPMKEAWNNVIYTCSNMLVFQAEKEIDKWCTRHNIPKGDVQPITNIWAFSQKWYGNHLDPHWEKWTMLEAKQIFQQYNLTHRIWELETSATRF
ncbi:MAG: alkylmercury lyase family protein [Chitinophagales bacterium]|nr:alkylmercury lyase family protein [Chitinophagales bacterium]